MLTALFVSCQFGLFGQVPPAASTPQPNAANPNLRLHPPRPGAPDPDWVLIDADEKQETDGPMRYLRKNVRLETSEMLLYADEVDYNTDTGEALARGHVRFQHFFNGDKIECDHATYNLDDETGVFYQVHGTSPSKIETRPGILTTSNPFYFEGQWAERIHEKYILHSGFITDCKVPRPWWTLRGPKFDVIPNDRAIAYRAFFRVRGIPLFYAPAFYKSLKRNPRKSGFLTPNMGHSSTRGWMAGLGYYWAISRSFDGMARVQYFTTRGPAETIDFRGKPIAGTDFNVSMYSVQDRGIAVGTNSNGSPIIQKQGGYAVTADDKSQLPDGWVARIHVDYLSSFLFRQAFSESFHEAIFSESRSVGYVTKHWSTFGVNLVADRDVQFFSIAPKDEVIIRKMPELQFGSREHTLVDGPVPLWFSLESSVGLLHRTEQDYETRQFVNRLDANPRLTSVMHFFGFSLEPSFAVRETEYGSSFLNDDQLGQPNYSPVVTGHDFLRSSRQFTAELTFPALARIYKPPKWLGEKMKHVIEARADYDYVGGINNFNQIVRFDQTDILSDTNEARFSLINRLFVKDKNGTVNEVLSWELRYARYFDPTFGGAVLPGQRNIVQSEADIDGFAFLSGPRNYSPIISALRFQHRVGIEWRMDYDPLYHKVVNSGFSADIHLANYFISAGEYEVNTNPVLAPNSSQVRGTIGWGNQNRKGWNGAFTSSYDLNLGRVQYSLAEVTYNTDCCGISAEYRRFNFGIRDETQYRVAFAVSNIGTFGTLRKQERIF